MEFFFFYFLNFVHIFQVEDEIRNANKNFFFISVIEGLNNGKRQYKNLYLF